MQKIIFALALISTTLSINFQVQQTTQQQTNQVDIERQRAEMERRTQELQAQIEQV